ncbi:MAG: transcription termination factor Rho [Verrucomicrobia bacterium]|nr:MAG: transcription termination factor Rho [Verrucomicrobiota bacterium]
MDKKSLRAKSAQDPSDPISADELQGKTVQELIAMIKERNIRLRTEASRHHLVLDLVRYFLSTGKKVFVEGILETTGEQGILRSLQFNFKPGVDDVHVPTALMRQYQLKPGLKISGYIRPPVEKERGLMLESVDTIEDTPISEWTTTKDFEKLTPLFPKRRIILESKMNPTRGARAVDIIAPLGMGQRGLIVAPPRSGKTMLLKEIAKAIRDNHPDIHLILLLVNERPEEVTDLRREISGEIVSSTFDEPISRHVQVCELVSERAKRLVELGKNVVILLDSITRMARGYNALQPSKGRTMSGGVDSKALTRPRRFFGAARNTEEGGSLTILATALVETQSKMDDLIFEEFKGTGNMEVHLDRTIADQRIFPAIHIVKSGTRKEELLYHPDEYQRIMLLRRKLSEVPAVEAMQVLANNLEATKTNAELLLCGVRGV